MQRKNADKNNYNTKKYIQKLPKYSELWPKTTESHRNAAPNYGNAPNATKTTELHRNAIKNFLKCLEHSKKISPLPNWPKKN